VIGLQMMMTGVLLALAGFVVDVFHEVLTGRSSSRAFRGFCSALSMAGGMAFFGGALAAVWL
jgi:hypothetical protein